MEELAREYAQRAHFLFIYTREAHPNQDFPYHTTYEQKVHHAMAFRDRGLARQVLADTLDGQVHIQYGGLPNMTWVVDHAGYVAFKASWTVATDVRDALKEVLQLRALRRGGGKIYRYYREILGLKESKT